MKITDFIAGNPRISIMSGNGTAIQVPDEWKPLLTASQCLVAIPDMHMYIATDPLDNFHFGSDTMIDFLNHVSRLADSMDDQGNTLRVYQIGDVFEELFPSRRYSGNAQPDEILASDPRNQQIINQFQAVNTHLLYGNHDFGMRHSQGYKFSALEDKVYLEHGFAADTWGDVSNPLAPLWEPAMQAFMLVRELEDFWTNLKIDLGLVPPDVHSEMGARPGDTPDASYPMGTPYRTEQLDWYSQRMKNNVLGPDTTTGANTRICVIGHTHNPHMEFVYNVDGSVRGLFVDCGAWTEGRSDFAVITDEEVALCRYLRASEIAPVV